MFEFLFKYPLSAFAKGKFVLLGSWPKSILIGLMAASALLLAWTLWRRSSQLAPALRGVRRTILWLLQSALLILLIFLLWQPAISVASLRPQQNVIAVMLDDSRSMALRDMGVSREEQALKTLHSGLLSKLENRFQVRFYQVGAGADRVSNMDQFKGSQSSTQLGKALKQLAGEAATLPIGAVVLLSDGADNSGGVDRDTLAELKRRRLPVHTIGFGREEMEKDVELDGFDVPAKALEDSRLQAQVTLRQRGFSGQRARLVLTGGGAILASREITLRDTPAQTEAIEFKAGKSGVKDLQLKIDPLKGEENTGNNLLKRVLSVDNTKRRILYVEGEPRWEYKFLRRAVEDDPAVEVASMLRTTQNKIYRQGIANANELADGFPTKPEELFDFQAIVLGSVEAAYFTTTQSQLIKDFVDRRGGGLLFLGGRASLADGGYNVAPFTELLPVNLPNRKDTFQRSFVAAELTEAGKKSLICRIEDDSEKSLKHWDLLPYLADYQDPGTPKPGALVLARVNTGGNNRVPLLVTENYGRGRTAVFATGGSWRWRMQQPVPDKSQETFWRQLLRWTVSAAPSRVVLSASNVNLNDDGRVQLRAEVRNKEYQLSSTATVSARAIGPDGGTTVIEMRPDAIRQGVFSADWDAPKTGSYVVEVTSREGTQVLGRDIVTLHREDGFAENFHVEQNRELLEKLSDETGGRYYKPTDANRLADEISYSEAGVTSREMKDLWDMPIIFLLILALRSSEWLLRRKWGVV
jgi:uncharacterized membrane protein